MARTLRPATTTQYSYMFDTTAGQAANASAQVFSEGLERERDRVPSAPHGAAIPGLKTYRCSPEVSCRGR